MVLHEQPGNSWTLLPQALGCKDIRVLHEQLGTKDNWILSCAAAAHDWWTVCTCDAHTHTHTHAHPVHRCFATCQRQF